MFWPFKRRPVQTMEQLAAQQPPAPCGQQTEHYFWELIEGMPCPGCLARKQMRKEQAEREQMAQLIADAVVAKLATKPTPSQDTQAEQKGGE